MAKAVFKMIPFGFQIIEVFVLDLPTAAPGFDQLGNILFSDEIAGDEGGAQTTVITQIILNQSTKSFSQLTGQSSHFLRLY